MNKIIFTSLLSLGLLGCGGSDNTNNSPVNPPPPIDPPEESIPPTEGLPPLPPIPPEICGNDCGEVLPPIDELPVLPPGNPGTPIEPPIDPEPCNDCGEPIDPTDPETPVEPPSAVEVIHGYICEKEASVIYDDRFLVFYDSKAESVGNPCTDDYKRHDIGVSYTYDINAQTLYTSIRTVSHSDPGDAPSLYIAINFYDENQITTGMVEGKAGFSMGNPTGTWLWSAYIPNNGQFDKYKYSSSDEVWEFLNTVEVPSDVVDITHTEAISKLNSTLNQFQPD